MASIRTMRQARTIRNAITACRKHSEQAAAGWVGIQSGNLKGLYGKAYLRTFESYKPSSPPKDWRGFPPGIYGGVV